jgi:hypothetical protein
MSFFNNIYESIALNKTMYYDISLYVLDEYIHNQFLSLVLHIQ